AGRLDQRCRAVGAARQPHRGTEPLRPERRRPDAAPPRLRRRRQGRPDHHRPARPPGEAGAAGAGAQVAAVQALPETAQPVPRRRRLPPPLGRDVVRTLLAEDTSLVTSLTPGEDGTFTPESLPEDSFRPLWDWIDYVLDHDKEALQAWVQASQFEFEPFICDE